MADRWGDSGITPSRVSAPPDFGTTPDDSFDEVEKVRPPTAWLYVSLVAVAAALVLFAWDTSVAHAVGYLVASFVAITAMGIFWRDDRAAQRRPNYVPQPSLLVVSRVVLLAAVVVSAAHIWLLASKLAR